MDEDQEKAFVLWWQYGDKSGMGIERVYQDEERAKEDFALVKKHGDRNWHLDPVPLFGDHM